MILRFAEYEEVMNILSMDFKGQASLDECSNFLKVI